MELSLDNFPLNFLGKDRLTIRELFLYFYANHQHIRIFGATGIPGELRFGVSLEQNDSAGFETALHQAMQSLSMIAREVHRDRND